MIELIPTSARSKSLRIKAGGFDSIETVQLHEVFVSKKLKTWNHLYPNMEPLYSSQQMCSLDLSSQVLNHFVKRTSSELPRSSELAPIHFMCFRCFRRLGVPGEVIHLLKRLQLHETIRRDRLSAVLRRMRCRHLPSRRLNATCFAVGKGRKWLEVSMPIRQQSHERTSLNVYSNYYRAMTSAYPNSQCIFLAGKQSERILVSFQLPHLPRKAIHRQRLI